MAKKKKDQYNIDDEIVIGYNSGNVRKKTPQTKKKNNKKKKKKDRIKRILKVILKALLLIVAVVGLIAFLFVSPIFNIAEINIVNANKISENTYIVLSDIELGENIFQINKSKIIQNIKSESYVESVEVKRIYPDTVEITVTEREVAYLIESNGRYVYIDKNGYILEANLEALDLPILKGIVTNLDNITTIQRLEEEDLSKLNDVIKIIDGIENNSIDEKLSYIDISDGSSYILGFEDEGKTIMLGDTSDLSTKMLWIKYFMDNRKGENGIIYLNTENIYFSPTD